ncbi:MAG TPA: T9SS type A sorting domain-containing protein [Paludibacteraceae bacterium]|nr:T9SS type A sorting domain-containing protein [Paludibacteraceae bacterium]HPT42333.1 T9SS type A sorting domain-containing protein [Paludibacteraceae bacterium]
MKKLLFFSFLLLMFGNIQAQKLTMVRNSYIAGEPISVKFTGSTSTKDWLAVFHQTTVPGSMNNEGWVYTSGTQDASSTLIESGAVIFSSGVTEPGIYKVCLLADDGYSVVTSVEFNVVTPVSGLVGEWKFDNPGNLVKATVGNDLQTNGTLISSVAGPTLTDGAVRVGVGSNFTLVHGITPFPNALVNTYSFVFDFKVSQLNKYYSFFQTSPANNNDAEVFLGKLGNVGVGATGYSSQTVRPNTWNRAIIVVNNGSEYSVYVNGVKGLTGYVQPVDGNFSLEPTLLLFGDDSGEDNEIDCANVQLYNKALTENEAQSLGGYVQDFRTLCSFLSKPYVQNVTSDSITVMWESDFIKAGSNKVNYGTNSDASGGAQIIATAYPSGANTYIQKAVIKPLQPGTTYFFRAISNSSPNMIQSVKTAPKDPNSVFTVGIWGDSRFLNPFTSMATYLVNNLAPDFCISTGNITINGNDSVELRKVFIPAVLETVGTKVPFIESLGNLDVDASLKGADIIRNYLVQPRIYNSDASKVSGSFAYEYGNSVFISIDPTRYNTDLARDGWLETFLKSDVSKKALFRFIFINNAPFYERCQKYEQEVVKTNIPLLSKKYGVTAVFSGRMHGYERGVIDGVQYITQGGCSNMDVDSIVGPTIYPHIVVGTNKTDNPANFNNGLMNHLLTLEINPEFATVNLHYFDGTGNYKGIIEIVQMAPRAPENLDAVSTPSELGFAISPNPTKGIIRINASGNVDLAVFNLQGVKVAGQLNVSPNTEINLSNLAKGAYLVRLKAGQNEFTKTILIN